MSQKSNFNNELSDIALAFSSAALDSSKWLGAMDLLNTKLGGVCCALEIANTKTGEAAMECSIKLEDDCLKHYEERIFHINPRIRSCMGQPVGAVADDRTLMDLSDPKAPEFLDWLETTPYYFIRGGKILDRDNLVAFFSCNYSRSHGIPGDDDERFQRMLFPHLVNVMEVSRMFADRGALSNTLIEKGLDSSHCFVLLDGKGAVTHCSPGMETYLKTSTCLTIRNRRLLPTEARYRALIDKFVASVLHEDVLAEQPIAIRLSGIDTQLGVMLRAVRVPASEELFRITSPRAMITVTDLDAPLRANHAEIRAVFGLTDREASICMLISEGIVPEAVAHRLSISMHTVREHLKSIYAKVGVSRQTELALVMQRLAMP